ncbi:hypothetical protein RN001_014837 [Aquatica leii]|uniref:Macro domain-containing protein n=1 Tax=Aquatica leii TaxID=1421715 RepID=A0AAN7QC37_9COLE|nr:hypothetical protein RN001_014837 [Aquatica leii]
MTKKKNQTKSSNPKQETKQEVKPMDDKNDCQEDNVETANDPLNGTSQLTRRQKRNMKQQEKKLQGEGNPNKQAYPKKKNLQKTDCKVSSPEKQNLPTEHSSKTETIQKDEDLETPEIEQESWMNVDYSTNKSKAMEAKNVQQSKDSAIVEPDPYRHQRKNQNVKRESAKEEKVAFDYFENEPLKNTDNTFRSSNKKARESKPSYQDNDATKNTDVSKEHTDKEFDKFNNLYKEKKFRESSFVKIKEIQEDLFNLPSTFSLAHCVAEDMSMGSGIAVQFSQKFKRRDDLYQQRQRQGGLAILEDNGRFIYYLVTKKLSNGKPTTYTMWNSLQKMQQHIQKHNVKNLAIPRIGCGLDRLEWSEVKAMIEYTFRDTDVHITVCNFQQPEEDTAKSLVPPKTTKCPVKNVRYPLVEIEPGTAIIYFGTVNGHVSEDLQSLDNKFRIIGDYMRANRKLGDVIQVYKNDQQYSLLGCITRNTEKDLFDFSSFQKCIVQVKKLNKNHYGYIGIQAFHDDHDDLLLNKIINMMRYSFIKVEVYVCWGGKMLNFMPSERGDYN